MKNTIDAIKYGLETLKVSPKELNSLIESSKGYDGDDYKRWLANEIIKIAEKDDVGYSQLLAKWFNLIQSIIEEYNNIENSNDLTIGIEVDVSNDIYVNANDATNKQNILESYYPSTDERTISAIAYSKNGSTDYVTVTKDNKNKIEELKQLKYNVVAYCVSNDSKNIEYEGWHNINDIKVKKI